MKGISKILSASVALMKLKNVYSKASFCSPTYDSVQPQQGMVQPSYVLIPGTPEAIKNCAYNPQNLYAPFSPTPSSAPFSTPTGTSNENETSPTEDVGTCKISVLKHCDTPGTSATPCESPEQVIQPQPSLTVASITSTIIAPVQASPVVAKVLQPTEMVVTTPSSVVSANQVIPGYYSNGTPAAPGQQGQILSGSVLAPGANLCQVVPGSTPGQVLPGAVPGFPQCQTGQNGSGNGGSSPVPGFPQCQAGQNGSGNGGSSPVPGFPQCQAGQNGSVTGQSGQFSPTPQVPNPVAMPPISGISGNGYPTSTTYASSLGPLGPCVDVQKPSSSCDQQTNERYSMEACAAPTPTVIIGNSEYFVAPGMYNAISSPCNSSCCQS
ncbi:polar tube protein Ptp1 [Encephalitozoon romaleae SJ-2008]|uniref:Polar tube protein Ptp1 n=1 Tax=Encephalitozoon romaleae (strain SJ-2008) TaxID=1178016 RepID=I6ZTW3_ENCRO|nr:polar tube protein Ptp1 [Encephalitozoon romaleae SJ-2008]AFN83111.1 polar tube protein Ptp1 [Encephalitozoon romaleae SJ-2008]